MEARRGWRGVCPCAEITWIRLRFTETQGGEDTGLRAPSEVGGDVDLESSVGSAGVLLWTWLLSLPTFCVFLFLGKFMVISVVPGVGVRA